MQHPSWGVAFYQRLANGPQSRNMLLYVHILFNPITFVLVHLQLLRPGNSEKGTRHRLIGLFRVMLFVLDPLLRNYESAALLICIWFSARSASPSLKCPGNYAGDSARSICGGITSGRPTGSD